MSLLVLPHTIDAGTEITAVEHQANYTAIRDIINGELEGGTSGNFKADGVSAREIADVIMERGLVHKLGGVFQEGILDAAAGTGLKVTTSGSGLGLNIASGNAWVADDSAVIASTALIPIINSGGSLSIAANASGNPRIDQIILTLTAFGTGTLSVLQGTATGGATLDNRNGAAVLPAGAIRLADILMPNAFAGPFVNNTHIRDRRQWAAGFQYANAAALPTANQTPAAATWTNLTGSGPARMEFAPSGSYMAVWMRINVTRSTAGLMMGHVGLSFDGAPGVFSVNALVDNASGSVTANGFQENGGVQGSHVIQAQCWANLAVAVFAQNTFQVLIQELPARSNTNDGA